MYLVTPHPIRDGLSGDDPSGFLQANEHVLIATPILSTEFSFKSGRFDTVICFFTALPSITDSYGQIMARIRGLNDRIVFAWYQTWAPNNNLAYAYTARQFVDAANEYDVAVDNVVGSMIDCDLSYGHSGMFKYPTYASAPRRRCNRHRG